MPLRAYWCRELHVRRGIQDATFCCVSTHGHPLGCSLRLVPPLILDPCTWHFLCGWGFRILAFSALLLPLHPSPPPALPSPSTPHTSWMGRALIYPALLLVLKDIFERGHMTAMCSSRHSRFSRKIWPHYSWYHIWTFISSEINYSSVKPLETTPHPNAAF